MQIFTRFVRSRRGNLATQAAIAFGAALAFPEMRDAQAAGMPELGVWINQEGKGAVEIKQCGAALCGNIVWLKNPINDQGQPLFDRRNPDETKRTRPICGLPVIGNVKRTSEGWDEGWIYNPEEGAQFDVALQASGDRLTVTGYKGIKLFSKTLIWTRAPADLQRCDGAGPQQTKAKPAVVPPKIAAPAPKDGAPAAAKKQAAPAAANALAKPAVAPAPTAAKKTLAKDAKAAPNAAKQGATPAKKTATTTPAKATAQPGAAPKKTAATAPGTKPPAPTAAKPPAKKPAATATASTAADKKAAVAPSDKKPAVKPPVKKKPADEDDESQSAVE